MSINPFKDQPKVDIGQSVTITAVTGGMITSQIDSFRQGVSIRDMRDFGSVLKPILTPGGIPSEANAKIDFGIGFNKTIFGQPKLHDDIGEGGKFNGVFAPFDDIVGKFSGRDFINDPGTQMYPNVMVSPNWTDPGALDGIIEPLTIRGKMPNAQAEGPHPAHDTRGAIMPTVGSEIMGLSVTIESSIPFEPVATIAPYFDAQDVPFQGTGFNLAIPGFDYPEQREISPFDDTKSLDSKSFAILNAATSGSREGGEFGTYQKSSPVGFIYRGGGYTIKQSPSLTGAKRVMGTDSIAFGGLLK
jgi:hypothetical protein